MQQVQRDPAIPTSVRGPGQSILNRENGENGDHFTLPEDGWVPLLPIGEFPGTILDRANGQRREVVQIYDRDNLAAMADTFTGEVLIDYDHLSHDLSKSTTAAGWLSALTLRDDGLYGQVRWTAKGRADLTGGNYRYISPELEDIEVEAKTEKSSDLARKAPAPLRVRPRRLTGAALTNRPALKTLPPIALRDVATEPTTTTTTTIPDMTDEILATLRSFLGLPAEADEAAIQTALAAIPEGQTLASLQQAATETETVIANRDALLKQLVEADLDRLVGEGRITNREEVRKHLITDREATLALISTLAPEPSDGETNPRQRRIYNRATATPPDTRISDLNEREDAAEAARAATIRNRAAEIQRTTGTSWAVAWGKAEQETPATTTTR